MNTKTDLELLEEGRFLELRQTLGTRNVVDIAQFLEDLEPDKLLRVFRILPKDISVDVFSYSSPETQQHIVESITDREVRALVDDLFLDDAIDFLEELPATVVKKVLKNTDEETRALINRFLQYPEESAGSIMTIELVDLKASFTVSHALSYIRETGVDKETIYTCYVTGETRNLIGTVALRHLIMARENTLISEIMEPNPIYVNTIDDQETVSAMFQRYDLMSMPVVDMEQRLVGIITIDDIVDIIQEENTEDFEKMAALLPAEDSYMNTSVFALAKNRIPWLLILMLLATITGKIISSFENVLASAMVLMAYIPMLMDTGGNAGLQSSTLIFRGMALDEITIREVWKVLFRELRVSFLVGAVLSIFNFARMMIFDHVSTAIALTVCLSLCLTVVIAKIIGCVLPMVAKKLGADPAIMASSLITTIVDMCSLLTFFYIASAILQIG